MFPRTYFLSSCLLTSSVSSCCTAPQPPNCKSIKIKLRLCHCDPPEPFRQPPSRRVAMARRYPSQSLLVHEFGHAVMNLTFGPTQAERIWSLYAAARDGGLYQPGVYMMENEQEYWATGEAATAAACSMHHATVQEAFVTVCAPHISMRARAVTFVVSQLELHLTHPCENICSAKSANYNCSRFP